MSVVVVGTQVLFILCFLPKCLLSNETDRKSNFTFGIIGGKTSALGDHPHLVSLQLDDRSHFCAGSLIDDLHVVTAAHCIFNEKGGLIDILKLQIQAGDVSISKTNVGRNRAIRLVKLIFVHLEYNLKKAKHDIGVLRLSRALTTNKLSKSRVISSIPLNQKLVKENAVCKTAGWGRTSLHSKISQKQNKVSLKILSNKICSKAYPGYFVSPYMICAGTHLGGKDSCKGDSGGGLVCNTVLSGIASFGYGCGLKNYPGVYTNVTHYKDWIKNCTRFEGTQEDIPLPWFKNVAPRNLQVDFLLLFILLIILKT